MFNIKFMGNYTSDKDLTKRKSIPKDAVEFGIVKDLKDVFVKGFFMLMPIIVIMVILTILKVKSIKYHLTMNIDVIIAFILIIILVYVLTIVHEVIHALFYPRKYLKTIWKSKRDGARFVYCEELVSKKRFVIMALAPMFILGIIPFIIWLILPNFIPMPYNLTFVITTWFMTLIAMGDIYNAYIVIKEVPKNHKLFNYGLLRSFYIK